MIGKTNAQTSAGGGIKGEKVNISLKTNQSSHDDLNGAIITVSYATVVEEYTWNGYTITVEIPPYVDYSVYTSGVEGYATPSSYSSTSVPENSKSVDLEYKTEVVSVTLSTDDGSSVKGASVTINGKSYTWNGTAITQKIAFGTSYTISVGEVSGMSTPSSQSFTANQTSRNVSFVYVASVLKVNILSNQSTDSSLDPTITNIKATVSYNGASVEVSNGEQINLPSGVEVTITFPEVEGYLKPNDITFTHNGGLVEKSGTYKCELLTVNVTADSGYVSGFEVTISKQDTVGVATKYTKLEYIESTGTQWIDTGYVAKTENYRVKCKFSISELSTTAVLFGGGASTDIISIMAQNPAKIYVGGGRIIRDTIYFTVGETHEMDCHANGGTFSMVFDGKTYSEAYTSTINKEYSLALFGNNASGSVNAMCKAKIYSFQIYDNGTLVRNYTPALRSDGIAGLYDAVNDTFYASSGTGNFLYGGESSEVIATQTSVTGTYKIPFDVSYTVQTSNVGGYDTPASQTFTADAVSRNVSVVYEAVKDEVLIVNVSSNDGGDIDGMNVFVEGIDVVNDGVYIQDTNGVLWNISDFDGSATPNGIAVINGEHRFVLALQDAYDVTFNWSASAINIDNIVETTSKDVAVADFNGQSNTDKILKQIGKTQALSANYCRRYVFPNGMTGYLGALGEWNIIVQNKSEIDRALTKCGGSSMSYWYHTSTEYAYNAIWAVNWNSASIDFIGKTGFVSRTRALSPLVVQKAVSGGNVTYTIPSGVTYKVSVSGIDGYATPASQTFTAIGGVRTISMQYVHHGGTKNPSNGIYIQDTDGFCHEVNKWSGTHTPNGVAVITDNCAFVVSLKYASSGSSWGGYKKTISDIITESSTSLATLDYLGLFNTDVINSQLNGYNDGYVNGAPAAGLCKSFVFPDGSVGYLGAAGEWKAILDNYGSIYTAFGKCGAEELSGSNWTSTQYNSEYSWIAVFGYDEISKATKTNAIKVRAFAVI